MTITEILEVIKEIIAIFHYISDILAVIEFLNLISAHGNLSGLIIWIVIAFISGIISEFIQSKIPTPFRIFF